jgi:methionine-rich copper-binding protein CopC
MNIKNLLVAGAVALAFGAASAAHAHARLEASEPKADTLLDASPKQIRLQFNEILEPAFSKITLVGANNSVIALSGLALDKANRKILTATVPPLQPGQYRMRWIAAGHDGHVTKGELSFRVK